MKLLSLVLNETQNSSNRSLILLYPFAAKRQRKKTYLHNFPLAIPLARIKIVIMKHLASSLLNKSKLTGGIALSVTLSALLSGVITSHPPNKGDLQWNT